MYTTPMAKLTKIIEFRAFSIKILISINLLLLLNTQNSVTSWIIDKIPKYSSATHSNKKIIILKIIINFIVHKNKITNIKRYQEADILYICSLTILDIRTFYIVDTN